MGNKSDRSTYPEFWQIYNSLFAALYLEVSLGRYEILDSYFPSLRILNLLHQVLWTLRIVEKSGDNLVFFPFSDLPFLPGCSNDFLFSFKVVLTVIWFSFGHAEMIVVYSFKMWHQDFPLILGKCSGIWF